MNDREQMRAVMTAYHDETLAAVRDRVVRMGLEEVEALLARLAEEWDETEGDRFPLLLKRLGWSVGVLSALEAGWLEEEK
jgi:hypothetical protein